MQILKAVKDLLKRTFLLNLVNYYRKQKGVRIQARQEKEVVAEWIKNGKPSPPPHAYKAITIRHYAKKYRVTVLIETGTYVGDTIKSCLGAFKNLITIELDEKLYERAVALFASDKHVILYQGDSGVRLKEITKTLDEPALFWLDGHYSEGITAKGDLNTPIIAEIQSILANPIKKHVILIDDAREFTGRNDYPTIPKLKDLVFEANPDLKFYVEDDIIRIHP